MLTEPRDTFEYHRQEAERRYGHHHSTIIRSLDELMRAIRWATSHRREWHANTIPAGWTLTVECFPGEDSDEVDKDMQERSNHD